MATIPRFTLVQIDAAQDGHAAVVPWNPGAYEQPGLSTTHKLLGVTMTTSEYQEPLAVMRRGVLRDVARQNAETWAVGDILWAKDDGSITKTRPAAPLPLVVIGTVFETISTLHTVDVDVRVLPSLGELSGVLVETPADLDVFIHKASTNLWEPRRLTHLTDLSNIQGGSASEQYHLTLAQHGPAADPQIQRGGAFISPTAAVAVMAWRAPYACTVLNVRGYRSGGTAVSVNARKNGASTHLAADLNLSSDVTWMDGGAVQNATYAAGDTLELLLQSVTGTPAQVVVQVDFRR